MLRRILQGRFMNHPLHPVFVHLPIGLWAASLAFDVIFKSSGNPAFAATSFFCIAAGLAGAMLAMPTGVAEYLKMSLSRRPKQIATTHLVLNVTVFVLFGVNLLMRFATRGGVPDQVTNAQLVLSLVAVSILGYSGYLGGVLVYRYGVGYRGESGAISPMGDPIRRPRSRNRAA